MSQDGWEVNTHIKPGKHTLNKHILKKYLIIPQTSWLKLIERCAVPKPERLVSAHKTWAVDARKHWRRLAWRLWELQMECVCAVAVSFCGSWKCVSCTAVGTALPPHAPAVPLPLWFTVWLFIRRLHAGACGRPPFHHALRQLGLLQTHTHCQPSPVHTHKASWIWTYYFQCRQDLCRY